MRCWLSTTSRPSTGSICARRNVIESAFATVRHRTVRSKGCLSNKTALAMIFKLAEAAEKSWRRLDGHNQLPKVILGVKFNDGIEVRQTRSSNRRRLIPFRHQHLTIAPIELAADAFGSRWRVDVPVSRQGRSVTVRTVWIVRADEKDPRFVTCWVL